MNTTKLLVCCLLAISATGSFANNTNEQMQNNAQNNSKETISNAENPFYPKYLNENIQHAVNAIVDMQLREDRKKLAELQRKEKARIEKERKERLAKQQGKSKRSYAKIPNSITAKSLTKNDLGGYEIVTKSGKTLKKGSRVYSGTVTAITNTFIYLDRNEKGATRHYKIKYNVSF